MASWEEYQTLVYTTPFNNGTHDAELRTLFASPVSGEDLPLLVFSVPYTWLMEVAYMRFAISALRRGYAVLIFEGPGAGMTLRLPPYMPSYANMTQVFEAVLDTAMEDPRMGPRVNGSSVVLVGLEAASYGVGQPCIDLKGRVAACVMSPPMPSVAKARASRMVVRFYSMFTNISMEQPELIPSEELLEAFLDPEALIYDPLLEDCTEESGAPQLFNAVFMLSGVFPDALYPILADSGGGPDYDTPEKLLAAGWHAWKRAQLSDAPWDPKDVEVPVLMTHGVDDKELLVTDPLEVFSQLPEEVQAVSQAIQFGPESGGALAGQRGASPLFEQALFSFLANVLPQADNSRRRSA